MRARSGSPSPCRLWSLALRRTAIGRLNAAAWIAMWGFLIPAFEHTYFGIVGALDSFAPSDHARVHMLMGLAYWPLGAVGLAVVMGTLLREGRREAWFLLLGVLVVGGGLEISSQRSGRALVPARLRVGFPARGYGPVRLPGGLGHRIGDRLPADLPVPAGHDGRVTPAGRAHPILVGVLRTTR